jgi:glycosyltransferase involved in cell wall biosynthesis
VDDRLGYVVSPDNASAFIQAATQLYTQPETRQAFGRAARDYAKQTFDWDPIYAQFEKALGLGSADCRLQNVERM